MRPVSGAATLLGLSLAVVLATAGPTPPAAHASDLVPLPAVQADSVVDSYGIGIHLPFLDTPYADPDKVADALSDLGVRHVRDDLFLDNPRQYDAIRTVAERGIRFNLIMGRPDRPGTPADYVRTVAGLPAGAVESVEGVNEWDLFGGEPDWAAETVAWQADLHKAVRSTPATASLPVLSPALAFRWNYADLPDLSEWSDVANAHMYPGGHRPTNEVGPITSALRSILPTEPLIVTEAGYHNAVNTTNGHHPVTEQVAGAYLPRLLLDHVSRGHERVYSYELIDEHADPGRTNPEAAFGLLRHDWSPKPAYTAMKTLLGLLSDPGPEFDTKPLRVAAAGWPADGRYLVTQKRDGTHVVLLWRDSQLFDPTRRETLPDPSASVTLRLGRTLDIGVHRLTGPEPVSESTGSSITLPMDGSVTAVTLREPAPLAPEPAPTSTTSSTPLAAVPGQVTIRAVKVRRRSVTVRWKAPASSTPILGYEVSARGRVKHVGASARKARVRVPRGRSLRVTVRARNVDGWGDVVRSGRLRTR